jgi:peptide chain release factor subunit 1
MNDQIQNEDCPNCSSNSFTLTSVIPIIEYLGDIAETVGTEVDVLSTETEEGVALLSTFGGIVAILRYKIGY